MSSLSNKASAWYVGTVLVLVLAFGLMYPESGAIVAAGGVLRAAILAGGVALFATQFPVPAAYTICLIVLGEPVLGLQLSHVTREQAALQLYYLSACLVLVGPATIKSVCERSKGGQNTCT